MKSITPNSLKLTTNNLGNIIIQIVVIFNFIIPAVAIPRSLFIFTFILLITIPHIIQIRLKVTEFLYLAILLMVAFLTFSYSNLLNTLMVFCFLIITKVIPKGIYLNKNSKVVILIGALSLVLQIFYFRFLGNSDTGRSGLGTDPNFSALLLFLLFFMMEKIKYNKLSFILLIIGTYFFQSRALLLAVIIYYILKIINNKYFFLQHIYAKLNFLKLVIASLLFILIMSFVIMRNFSFKHSENDSLSDRIVNLNDESNKGRFGANLFWINEITNDMSLFKIYEIEKLKLNEQILIPHNSAIYLVLTSSLIFSIFYITLISKLINDFYFKTNMEYIISYLFFSLFLHGLFSAIYLITFFSILLVKSDNIKSSIN